MRPKALTQYLHISSTALTTVDIGKSMGQIPFLWMFPIKSATGSKNLKVKFVYSRQNISQLILITVG
jgi:hypothetical protein